LPRYVHIVAGMIATTFAAGPCVVLILAAMAPLLGRQTDLLVLASDSSKWLDIAKGLAGSSIAGLICSLPASILNTVAQEKCARVKWDSWKVAVASGTMAGIIVPAVLFPRFSGSASVAWILAMGLTGVLMGLLYWSIAIRPRRNLRLASLQTQTS
jgi:hypothetical protein